MKEQNTDMRKTMAGLRGSLKAYERRDFEKERELNLMGKKMGDLMSADQLREELIDKEAKIKELEQLNLENEKLLQTFEQELEKKTKQIEDLEYQNGSKTEEIHEIKFKLNEYRKKFEKYTTIEQKINVLLLENKNLKEDLASKKNQVIVMPEDNRDAHEDLIAQLERQIQNLKDLTAKLKAENEEWRKKYEDAKARNEFLLKQRDETLDKLNKLEYRYDDKWRECDEKIMLGAKLMTKLFVMTCELRKMKGI